MARRAVIFSQGEYYHIYNRGVSRQALFYCDENYRFLLRRVRQYAETWRVAIIAYCLMPNHYHFVLRQEGEFPLSRFVQAVFNSYTKALNAMVGRSGTLFEGPFQAIHLDNETYLLQLCRYVHRNPLDAGLVSDLREWPYSNYLEWTGQRSGTLVDQQFVRHYFPTPEAYEQFVKEGEPGARCDAPSRCVAPER